MRRHCCCSHCLQARRARLGRAHDVIGVASLIALGYRRHHVVVIVAAVVTLSSRREWASGRVGERARVSDTPSSSSSCHQWHWAIDDIASTSSMWLCWCCCTSHRSYCCSIVLSVVAVSARHVAAHVCIYVVVVAMFLNPESTVQACGCACSIVIFVIVVPG